MYEDLKQQVVAVLSELPEEISSLPGEVFSSGFSTLKRSNFYITGLNPGGGDSYLSVRDHVTNWNLDRYSAYTDQCWNETCWDQDCYGLQNTLTCNCTRGNSKHQEAVRRLVARCGNLLPHDVFATQAIFPKSRNAGTFADETGYKLVDAFEACWPMQRHFLSIVQPKIIICLGYQAGGSPFSLLQRKLHPLTEIKEHRFGKRRDASFKWANVRFKDSSISGNPLLIGVRHPSWVVDAADCDEFEALIRNELARDAA